MMLLEAVMVELTPIIENDAGTPSTRTPYPPLQVIAELLRMETVAVLALLAK
jgi:hypothetical protein